MKLCSIQIRPARGGVEENTATHLELLELAAAKGAELAVFPELSLTGYEPTLARELAFRLDDARLDVFQRTSDELALIVGLGLPLDFGREVRIGMAWFRPRRERQSYEKRLLHESELPFFAPGHQALVLEARSQRLAPAICYESVQPSHAQEAARLGASVYLASVAKSNVELAQAFLHYSAIARRHRFAVVMANCVGNSHDFVSAGQSAVWSSTGELLAHLDDESDGFVLLDTETNLASAHAR